MDFKPEYFSDFEEFEVFIKDHSNELRYLQVINGTNDEEPLTVYQGRVETVKQLSDGEIQLEFITEGEDKHSYRFSDIRLTNSPIKPAKNQSVNTGYEVAPPNISVFNSFSAFADAEKYKRQIFNIVQLNLDAEAADLNECVEHNQLGQIKKVTVLDDGDVLIGFELFVDDLEDDTGLIDTKEVVYHRLSQIQLSFYPQDAIDTKELGEEEECDV